LKIENFQSQVCVCAASINLTCAKCSAEIGWKICGRGGHPNGMGGSIHGNQFSGAVGWCVSRLHLKITFCGRPISGCLTFKLFGYRINCILCQGQFFASCEDAVAMGGGNREQ